MLHLVIGGTFRKTLSVLFSVAPEALDDGAYSPAAHGHCARQALFLS